MPLIRKLPEKLPDEVVRKFRELVEKTEKTGLEHGVALCLTEKGKLTVGEECVGTECELKRQPRCREGRYVGFFHTHPTGGNLAFSLGDVLTMLVESTSNSDSSLWCLGASGVRYFLCHILTKDVSEDEVREFYGEHLKEFEETGGATGIRRMNPSWYHRYFKPDLYDSEGRRLHVLTSPDNLSKAIRETTKAYFFHQIKRLSEKARSNETREVLRDLWERAERLIRERGGFSMECSINGTRVVMHSLRTKDDFIRAYVECDDRRLRMDLTDECMDFGTIFGPKASESCMHEARRLVNSRFYRTFLINYREDLRRALEERLRERLRVVV